MVFEFSWQIGAGENSQIPVKSSTIHSPSNDTIFVSGNDEPRFLNCVRLLCNRRKERKVHQISASNLNLTRSLMVWKALQTERALASIALYAIFDAVALIAGTRTAHERQTTIASDRRRWPRRSCWTFIPSSHFGRIHISLPAGIGIGRSLSHLLQRFPYCSSNGYDIRYHVVNPYACANAPVSSGADFNTIYITFQGNRLNHAELTLIEVRLHKDVKGADCVGRSSSRVEWSEMERWDEAATKEHQPQADSTSESRGGRRRPRLLELSRELTERS